MVISRQLCPRLLSAAKALETQKRKRLARARHHQLLNAIEIHQRQSKCDDET